jgi:hypothetical protein
VDYNLLRSWLGLPPGLWPPDHYTLLGFAAGNSDSAAVEPRVMQKMDLLRRNQLLHPELVTEGMNRLAQALITLTDPIGKAAYDTELGLDASPPVQVLFPVFPKSPAPGESPAAAVIVAEPVLEDDFLTEDAPAERPDSTDLTQEIVLPAGGLVQLYEVLEADDPLPLALPFVEPVKAEPVEQIVEGVPVERPAVRPWPTPPSSRRWIYARLALIRKAQRGWNRLGPILGDPQDPIDRPGRVLLLLDAVASIRTHLTALTGVVGGLGEPGGIVASIVNQPLLLDTIRRLLPDQREALAIDWRRGQVELQREHARLRRLARETRARADGVPRLPASVRWLRDFPELLLVALALFALFIALARSAIGR